MEENKNTQKTNSFFKNVSLMLTLITKRDKAILFVLFLATLLSTLIETFGVSVIMPFITLATNPDLILNQRVASKIYYFFDFKSTNHFMICFAFILIGFYIFRACYTVAYAYFINRFVYRKYHFFSYSIFCKVVKSDYEKFAKRNQDIIRKDIVSESMNASSFLSNFLGIFAEVSTMLLLYAILLKISWKMTLVLTFILCVNVILIIKSVGKVAGRQGEKRSKADEEFFKILSQTLGNFKIVKLHANEEENFRIFEQALLKKTRAQTLFSTIGTLPRSTLETVGFCVLVACVGYILFAYGSASAVLPIISMYALALYRILPSVTKVLDSYNTMIFMGKSVEQVYNAMKEDNNDEGNDPIEFNKKIQLKDISFGYHQGKNVLSHFNLEIQKGEKVAFVGRSGAGKSTLIDLIIGILKPKSGEIYIDDQKISSHNIKSWRKKIGYIPQSIYLFDGTVGENIAFGSKIDKKRLTQVTKMAKIYDFLQEHKGFDTMVGDGGNLLSGGQKQRIGIARALYHDPDILVLDEATSALDTQTESAIMDEIYQIAKDKTLLVIAHRLSTIERCDRKITVSQEASS